MVGVGRYGKDQQGSTFLWSLWCKCVYRYHEMGPRDGGWGPVEYCITNYWNIVRIISTFSSATLVPCCCTGHSVGVNML